MSGLGPFNLSRRPDSKNTPTCLASTSNGGNPPPAHVNRDAPAAALVGVGRDLHHRIVCSNGTPEVPSKSGHSSLTPSLYTDDDNNNNNTQTQRQMHMPSPYFLIEGRAKNGEGEYWDSYGMPPIVPNHKKFLNRLCKKWTYNHASLQSIDSEVCGEYCLLYLVHRAHGISLHTFVKKLFCSDTEKNDKIVHNMVKRMFGNKKKCVFSHDIKVQRACTRKK